MLLGSDVSHWRPVSDYAAYKASGREFLLFKATDFKNGEWFVDPTYAVNRAGCDAAGLVPGAYLFLRARLSGAEQAMHYLRTLGETRGIILAVDFEPHPPTDSFPTYDQLTECVQTIFDSTGRQPWVYTNRGYWNQIGNPAAPVPYLWHSEWRPALGPMYGGWVHPVCWQYTDRQTVPGISLPCDDNQFFGTRFDLLDHAGSEMADASDRGWGNPCPDSSITNIRVGGRSFNVHRRVAKLFTYFVQELVDRGYRIDEGQLDDWSYVCRHIDNDPNKPWSNHAWGLAIDINSLTNPRKSPLTTDMPRWVRDSEALMRKYGLRWGGAFVSSTPDPMHFEFMLTPADADRITRELEDVMTDAQMQELKDYIDKRVEAGERRTARYVDHGNVETSGTGNHHERMLQSIMASFGQMFADMTRLEQKVDALAVGGVDPGAVANKVWDEFAERAPRLEGDN